MKATITLEDTETGEVTIDYAFSEPVTIEETQSVAALLTVAIIMCACKAGGVSVYPTETAETHEYAIVPPQSELDFQAA